MKKDKKLDDHVMTPDEVAVTNLEFNEYTILVAIAILENLNTPIPPEMVRELRRIQTGLNMLRYLHQFPAGEERIAERERIKREGSPKEIFKSDDNFIVEGTETIH